MIFVREGPFRHREVQKGQITKQEVRAIALRADLSPATVDVFLAGPEPVIQNLTSEDVVVFVSLAGFTEGSYLVEVDYDVLLDQVRIESINPDTIEVIIRIDDGTFVPTATPTPTSTTAP